MPIDIHFGLPSLLGFLLVLARLGSALLFVPIPGLKALPDPARAFLVLALCAALYPLWPSYNQIHAGAGAFLLMFAGEAAFGLAIGVVVGFLSEIVVFTVQAVAVQAGFAYASSVDPNSEADSSVLQIVAQLLTNLLFFSSGLDRFVLRSFARSLEVWPPGQVELRWNAAQAVAGAGAMMMDLGLRLALPIAALLLLTDVTLALLGRIQSQLQLLTLAFPVKMLGALVALAALVPLVPMLYAQGLERVSHIVEGLLH